MGQSIRYHDLKWLRKNGDDRQEFSTDTKEHSYSCIQQIRELIFNRVYDRFYIATDIPWCTKTEIIGLGSKSNHISFAD